MIVDTHQHVFWHGGNDRDLIADMDAHCIDIAWLLTWEAPSVEEAGRHGHVFNPAHARPDGTHDGMPLRDVLTACERHGGRFVPGYCPDPARPDAPALLESARRMHGVRVCGEWKYRCLIDDPRCLELFRKAGELGCPVVVHLDVPYLPDAKTGEPKYCPLWYGGTIDNLRRAAEACPQTTFLGHGPGFWREISADADAAAQMYPDGPVAPGGRLYDAFEACPNLHADLSANSALGALKRDVEHARGFLRRYADRLLFGRDMLGGALLEFFDSLDLPGEVIEKIHSLNALRLVPPAAPS